jgi:hypothetical protein
VSWMKGLVVGVGVLVIALGVGYVVAILVAFSETTHPERLARLLEDPMAHYEGVGLELVERVEEDARDTWKTSQEARISQRYAVTERAAALAAYERIVADALRHGWVAEPSGIDDRADRANFTKGGMSLFVGLYELSGPPEIRIVLRD